MKVYKETIKIESKSEIEFIDITREVEEAIHSSGVREGQVLVFAPHTTAGIMVNHNEPMLLQDLMRLLYRLAPISDRYSHDLFELNRAKASDGRSNGHSHCKVMFIGISETLPIEKGHVLLSERQAIFLAEMDGARSRDVIVQVMGQ